MNDGEQAEKANLKNMKAVKILKTKFLFTDHETLNYAIKKQTDLRNYWTALVRDTERKGGRESEKREVE